MHMNSKDVKKLNRITDAEDNRVIFLIMILTPIALAMWALIFWICE